MDTPGIRAAPGARAPEPDIPRLTGEPATKSILLNTALIAAAALAPATPSRAQADEPFTQTWASLKGYHCPEWFRDAKFGIYAHWGPYSATGARGNTDWYSHYMYIRGSASNRFHLEHFGSLAAFGYKDLIPRFTAEKFDADAWVDLFVEAGARFAGPVGEHADGFAMWDSRVTRWNARAMGPRRDIVAAMERAIRKRGLKFMVSLHHQWKWGWYPTMDPRADCSNPAYAGLYGPALPTGAWGTKQAGGRIDVLQPDPRPTQAFQAEWLAKVEEVITNYRPDLLWFDNRMSILAESTRIEMVSFYYNRARAWKRPVVLTYKRPDLQEGTATIDLERARMPDIYSQPWLTDSSVARSSWAYASDLEYYSVDRLVDDLVDIVSKNGCLLLNIAPAPDGTIPPEQQRLLRGIGAWLRANGEAIYATRPWKVFGEGPTRTPQGHLADLEFKGFTARDVRFTRSKDGTSLYIIALGWPDDGMLKLRSLARKNAEIRSLGLLGYSDVLGWKQTSEALDLHLPRRPRGRYAHVLKARLGAPSRRPPGQRGTPGGSSDQEACGSMP